MSSASSVHKRPKFETEPISPPFCECTKKGALRPEKSIPKSRSLACQCGEDKGELQWSWEETERFDVSFDENIVTFHPSYSQGTAVIRGETPLELGHHHYWEIKMMTFLSGTDVMFGIGTDKANPSKYAYKFTSFLGLDTESWGYSYRGSIQHNGQFKYYGKRFCRGSIVGIYVDLERGLLEFYLNRRPLGKAFQIPVDKSVKLYPMVSCTSAKTVVKLLNSTSIRSSLQYNCMRAISRRPQFLEVCNCLKILIIQSLNT